MNESMAKRMTRVLIEEKLRQLAVMQAALAGSAVQYKYHDDIKWQDCDGLPSDWYWNMMNYRVKPEAR